MLSKNPGNLAANHDVGEANTHGKPHVASCIDTAEAMNRGRKERGREQKRTCGGARTDTD